MIIYVFNLNEEVVTSLDSDKKEVDTLIHHRRINSGNTGDDNYIEIDIPASIEQAEYVIEGNYLGFNDIDDNFQMFRIVRYDDEDNQGTLMRRIYAPHVVYELRDSIVEDKKPRDVSAETAISSALSTEATATRWEAGDVDAFGSNNINFYYKSSWASLLAIRNRWSYIDDNGLEQYGIINPRLEFTGNTISTRYIDFKKEIGTFRGKTFTIDRDLKAINREVDLSNIATALYAFGKGEEIEQETQAADKQTTGTSYGKRITIEGQEWIKADSDLLNPDFEDGLDNWTIALSTATVVQTPTNVGSNSIQLGVSGGSSVGMIVSDPVDITVGKTYNARCLVYAPNDSVIASIRLVYRSSGGGFVKDYYSRVIPTPNTWTLLLVEGEAPVGADYAEMYIFNPSESNDILYVDKARLGDYANKPLNQGWIEDTEAKARWGYDGGTRNIFKKYVNSDTTSPSILIQQAWWKLQELKEPKVSYGMKVMDLEYLNPEVEHEKVRIGDSVYIKDFNFTPELNIYGRVNEIKRNYLSPENTKLTISNFFEETLDSTTTTEEIKEETDNKGGIWNNGTLYEPTPTGDNTRIRLVEIEDGNFASELRYEDDEGNLVGYFNSTEFQYNEIYGGNIYAQNLLDVDKNEKTYYVNSTTGDDLNDGLTSGTAWRTINKAIRTLPKVLLNTITIFLQGSTVYQEDVHINGLMGGGLLQINADAGVVIYGQLKVSSCQCPVFITGNGTTSNSDYLQVHSVRPSGSNYSPLETYNCQKVRFRYVWSNANTYGVHGLRNDASNVYLEECVLSNANGGFSGGVTSLEMANTYVDTCKGSNNTNGVYCVRAGSAGLDTSYPQGTTNKNSDVSSFITDGGTATPTAEPTPPTNPARQYLTTCIASNSRTYNYRHKLWNTDTKVVKQGRINVDSGNNVGFMFFNGTNTFSSLSGKTIYSAKLFIKRKTGGLSNAKLLRFYGHTYLGEPGEGTGSDAPSIYPVFGTYSYGELASIKWQEELNFLMPQSFLTDVGNGSIDGLLIYQSDAYPYVQLEGTDEYEIKIEFKHS